MLTHVRARPRMFISAGAGLVAGVAAFNIESPVTRVLFGWNVAVWLFLLLILVMMLRADHEKLRRNSIAQAESAATVLAIVTVAAVASIVAIILELAAAKQPGGHHAWQHVLFALATVSGAWLLLPTLFAMNYASLYFQNEHGRGLNFPSSDATYRPDYADFLYFSYTIAVASQTADVSISTRAMRRLVLLQALLSFVFNTTILAFTINIAASLF
jgi:uncharacterized membrane protein